MTSRTVWSAAGVSGIRISRNQDCSTPDWRDAASSVGHRLVNSALEVAARRKINTGSAGHRAILAGIPPALSEVEGLATRELLLSAGTKLGTYEVSAAIGA